MIPWYLEDKYSLEDILMIAAATKDKEALGYYDHQIKQEHYYKEIQL